MPDVSDLDFEQTLNLEIPKIPLKWFQPVIFKEDIRGKKFLKKFWRKVEVVFNVVHRNMLYLIFQQL